jgi:hypothetical protein
MPQREQYGYSRGTAIAGGLLVDVTEEARTTGIDIPVAIRADLAHELEPSRFLSDLGITFPDRVRNLLTLVSQQLEPIPEAGQEAFQESRFSIPLVVLKGPIVREECVPVIGIVHAGDDGNPVITLIRAKEEEDGNELRRT